MPSMTHEALLLLFRNRPELAPALLRESLGITLPAYSEARIESADLSEVSPAEYRADLVVLLVSGKPVLAIVVEAQLQPDARKRFTWPVYVSNLRARFECEACVLVVTPDETVAQWARTPIALGPGAQLTPLVIGPNSVPVVTDHARAKQDPELAVLSAMAHGRAECGFAIASAAFEACGELDEERAMLYLDLVDISLGAIARKAFEELMATGTYEFQGEFAKKHRAEGVLLGEAKGRNEGVLLGEAKAVVIFLEARAIAVSDEQKARILGCSDGETLARWLRAAVTAATVDDLFHA